MNTNTSNKRLDIHIWVPWMLFGVGAIATVWVIAAPLVRTSNHATIAYLLTTAPYSAIPLPFALLGALVITKQRHNPLGWLMLLPSLASYMDVLGGVALQQAQRAFSNPPSVAFLLGLWADTTSWVLSVHPILLILLLFPTGYPSSRRWHLVTFGIIGNSVFTLVLIGLGRHLYSFDKSVQAINPIGVLDDAIVDSLVIGAELAVGILAILCVAALVARYRRGSVQEKVQIRWIAYAGGLFGICYVTAIVILVMFGLSWDSADPVAIAVLVPAGVAMHGLPIAIGVAILRHRLFDIDVIIRRTLVYSVLSAMLTAAYFGLVATLQNAFRALTGQESQLAIVASTLSIAALFLPFRSRIQTFIDQRFYRAKYDATQILTRFTHDVRDAVELDDISHRLVDSIEATLQPERIMLWVSSITQLPSNKA